MSFSAGSEWPVASGMTVDGGSAGMTVDRGSAGMTVDRGSAGQSAVAVPFRQAKSSAPSGHAFAVEEPSSFYQSLQAMQPSMPRNQSFGPRNAEPPTGSYSLVLSALQQQTQQMQQQQTQQHSGVLVVPKAALYVSSNRGLETLAASVDVEALDASEAVSLPFQPTATRSLDLSTLALKSSGGLGYISRPDLDLSVHQRLSSWTPGWKSEMGLEPHEQAMLKGILTQRSNGALETLVQKLWSIANGVCNQTDRFYSQVQRAYAHEIPSLQQGIIEANARAKSAEAFSQQSQSQVVAQQQKELIALRKHRDQNALVCKQLKEALQCPICTEVAILPKVLGTCGHIACQNCLKQLDDVAFATLTQSGAGASARQHLLARRCPLCRVEIIGAAFPVLPLKDVASILIANAFIEVADNASVMKHIEFKAIAYEKETPEQKHIAALQLGCYAQSQLAQHSVSEVITKILAEQWRTGVYIMFESAVSRVFFETFATTLHGRAGGVNVLVNAAQRMLAVQLVEKKTKEKADAKAKTAPHLLVKVATDGRFTITTATPTNAVANPATAVVDTPKPSPPSGASGGLPVTGRPHVMSGGLPCEAVGDMVSTPKPWSCSGLVPMARPVTITIVYDALGAPETPVFTFDVSALERLFNATTTTKSSNPVPPNPVQSAPCAAPCAVPPAALPAAPLAALPAAPPAAPPTEPNRLEKDHGQSAPCAAPRGEWSDVPTLKEFREYILSLSDNNPYCQAFAELERERIVRMAPHETTAESEPEGTML